MHDGRGARGGLGKAKARGEPGCDRRGGGELPAAMHKTYVRVTAPVYTPAERSVARARSRADWRYLELATGHDCMVSWPQGTARLLLSLQ